MNKDENQSTEQNTEQQILAAARRVFTQKGFAAARMDDIAKEAGINRALLHYYFRSKVKMFDMIFEENLQVFYGNFHRILSTDAPIRDKIRDLVHAEIDTLLERPELPLFIVNEIARNPDGLSEKLKSVGIQRFFKEFARQFQEEVDRGDIRPADPKQFLMSLMSMCIFPFVGKPMLQQVMGFSDDMFREMMQARKHEVIYILIHSLEKP